jgi:hypothetical protein
VSHACPVTIPDAADNDVCAVPTPDANAANAANNSAANAVATDAAADTITTGAHIDATIGTNGLSFVQQCAMRCKNCG